MVGRFTEIIGVPVDADLVGFGATLQNAAGCERLYSGIEVNDPSLVIFVICWTDKAANEAYNADESTKAFIRAFAQFLDAHPNKDKIFHSYLESSEHPSDIFTASLTEISLCTIRPDADAKLFEELYGKYNVEKNRNGELGSWGKDTRNEKRYIITNARQSLEESNSASTEILDTPEGKVMAGMVETNEIKHTSLQIVERPSN